MRVKRHRNVFNKFLSLFCNILLPTSSCNKTRGANSYYEKLLTPTDSNVNLLVSAGVFNCFYCRLS